MFPRDVHADLPVVLDVLHLGAGPADEKPVAPFLDVQLLVHLTRVRELVVLVHQNVVDDILGLLDILLAARKHDLALLRRRRALGHVLEVDLDIHQLLDLPNDRALLADEVRERRRVDVHDVLREAIERQCAVALLDQFLDGTLGHLDGLGLAHDGEDLALGVDAIHLALLLDHLDLRAFRADDDADLVLGHVDRGAGAGARRLLGLLLSGNLHGQDPLHVRGHGLVRSPRLPPGAGLCASGRHADDVLLVGRHGPAAGTDLHFIGGPLLTLVGLLGEPGGGLPSRARAVVDDEDHGVLLLLLGLLLFDLNRLRNGLRLLLALRLRLRRRRRRRLRLRCRRRRRLGLALGLGRRGRRLGLGLGFGLRFRLRLRIRRLGRGRLRLALGLGLALLGLRG
mmetsp:Transcript_154495/g.494167  ORF Transcript_154495/g.494167 Transcript_154495/m.494167 type:complete len:397 (+) Transcript_154495:251-1441(+)